MAMLKVIKKAGLILGDGRTHNFTALANALGCHRSSLYIWKKIPLKYVEPLVKVTNGQITAKMIRPDLFK